MELDDGFGPNDVKSEAIEQDQREDTEFEDSITFENTVLMKTEPPNLECKVDAQQLELHSESNDEVEMSVTDCHHHPDMFCYVCGVYMCQRKNRKRSTERSISIATRLPFPRLYSDYFGLEIRDQHEPWVPHYVCTPCYSQLTKWKCGSGKGLPFGAPRIWSKPSNHFDDCYFCLAIITMGTKPNIYPDLPSSRPPDYCKVAPGRNKSKHSVELPMESGCPNNANGIKLEEIEQECVSTEILRADPENPTAKCKQRPDKFCYICGSYTLAKKKCPMNDPNIWRLYAVYFELDVDPPVHPWEPKFSCGSCFKRLNETKKAMVYPLECQEYGRNPPIITRWTATSVWYLVHGRRQLNFDVDIPSSRAPDYSKKAPGKIENLQAFDDFILKDVQQESHTSKEEEKDPFANCKRHPDEFCYVCGHYIDKKYSLGTRLWAAYKEYFQLDVELPAQPWEPKFMCQSCCPWYNGNKRFIRFAIPRRWQEPTDHVTDCYFCLVDNGGPISSWTYPNLPSSRAPVPVDADHPKREPRVVVKQENCR